MTLDTTWVTALDTTDVVESTNWEIFSVFNIMNRSRTLGSRADVLIIGFWLLVR